MEPRSLYELFEQTTTANAERVAFRHKKNGVWIDVTWAEHRQVVRRAARSLRALGVGKGERVCILSESRIAWMQIDMAAVTTGAVTVGIYHSSLPTDCAFIIDHCEARILFVEDGTQLEKITSLRAGMPTIRHVVVLDGAGDPEHGVLGWNEYLDRGNDVSDEDLDSAGSEILPSDLAAIVYTSGTTGAPKGAMISHGNMLFTIWSASRCLIAEPHYVTLLFLPLAHVFARMIGYLCLRCALTIAFAEDVGKIAANIREVRPHFICSVPRIYEKIHKKVVSSAEDAGGLKKRLFDWAIGIGGEVATRRLARQPVPIGIALQNRIADRLVFRKVRNALGGRLVWAVSGAAPLNKTVGAFFHACGINLVEGLGMTENTSLSNANRLDHNKLGSVGPVVPGVEMKLAADGELLIRGDNVMQGYYKDPEATAQAIDEDGWLHTGDIGEIDEDGFLTLTDRKKDLLITSGGKNVAPQRVEKILRTSRYISQAVACGDRRKFISALVTLDPDSIRHWARSHGLETIPVESLASHPDVAALIDSEIAERNRELASYESVKKFRILPRDLSIEDGELTPTLKIKRKVVADKHRDLLEEIYRD